MMYYSELSSKMINIFPLLMNNSAKINFINKIFYYLLFKYSYLCVVILIKKCCNQIVLK